MTIEKTIEGAKDALDRADGVTSTIAGASKHIGALIIACGYRVSIIEEQERQIAAIRDRLDYDPSCLRRKEMNQ